MKLKFQIALLIAHLLHTSRATWQSGLVAQSVSVATNEPVEKLVSD